MGNTMSKLYYSVCVEVDTDEGEGQECILSVGSFQSALSLMNRLWLSHGGTKATSIRYTDNLLDYVVIKQPARVSSGK